MSESERDERGQRVGQMRRGKTMREGKRVWRWRRVQRRGRRLRMEIEREI